MPADPDPAEFTALAAERFVSLSTYRKSGEVVSTAVWLAGLDGALVVTTGAASGKVKRLRRDPRLVMAPCDRRGRVSPGAPRVHGVAQVLTLPEAGGGPEAALAAKYGVQYRLIMAVGRLRRVDPASRAIVRIMPA